MKNIFKIFILITSILLSNTIKSEELSNIVTPKCEELIKSAMTTSSFDLNIKDCSYDIFINNLSNKLLYAVYGDVILELIDFATIIPLIDDFEVDQAKSELENIIPIYRISNTIKDLTKLINWGGIFLLVIIYGKMLLSHQTKDGFDKEFIKNNLKIAFGLSLLVPIDGIGFSMLQAGILAGVFITVMVANSVWMVSMFFIQKMILKDQITPDVENEGYKELVISMKSEYFTAVLENAKAQLCDIRTIEKAIDQTMIGKKTFGNLQNNEVFKCLQEPLSNSVIESYGSNMPTNFIKSEYCLFKHKLLYTTGEYCGEFSSSDNKNVDEIRGILGISNDAHQTTMRKAALGMHKYMCEIYGDGNKIGFNKEFSCIQQDIGYDYKYDQETGELLTIANTSDSQADLSLGISSILDFIINNNTILKDAETNYMSIITPVVLLVSKENGSIDKFLVSFLHDIKKGWLGSASIYFPKNDFIMSEDDVVDSLLDAMSFTYRGNTLYNGKYVNQSKLNGNVNYTEEFIENNRVGKLVSNLNTMFNSQNNSKSLEFEEESIRPKTFSLLNIINSGNILNGGVKNCLKELDNDNCSLVSVNPIKSLVKEGMRITEYSVPGKMITSFIKNRLRAQHTNRKGEATFDGKGQIGIVDIADTTFSILAAVGLFLTYAIPLIPFFVFASVIIGWILNVFKTIVASQIIALLFIIPTKDENFEGHESSIYKLLINVLISPIFIVIGAIVCFILMHVMVAVTNVTFYSIVEFLNVNASTNSISQAIDNMFALVIYVVIITLMIIKCSTAMYKIPEALRDWFNLEVDNEEQMFSTLQNIVTKIIYMDVRFG
jgi:conjugal transfer/type IV secretion protein DotA/TraY